MIVVVVAAAAVVDANVVEVVLDEDECVAVVGAGAAAVAAGLGRFAGPCVGEERQVATRIRKHLRPTTRRLSVSQNLYRKGTVSLAWDGSP